MEKFSIAAAAILMSGFADAAFATGDGAFEAPLQLAPAIRSEAVVTPSPQTIQLRAVTSFLSAPVVIDTAALRRAPRVVADTERSYLGKGDRMRVTGDLQGAEEFRVLRPMRRLRDAVGGDYLGDEMTVLGKAKLLNQNHNGVHHFVITESMQEIVAGDVLLPELPQSSASQQPAAMRGDALSEASVISIADGHARAAQHQVIGIDKGVRDGVAEGMLLALYPAGQSFRQESGRLLVFRVFDRVSYGLITQAVEPLQVGDKARAPY